MIKISFPNIDTFIADMSRFSKALDGEITKEAAPEMQKEFFKSNSKTFKNLGGKHGSWKPLSKDYKRWKSKHYPGRPLMVLRGDLKKSLTKKDENNIFSPSYSNHKFRLTLGTQVKYSLFHQIGAGKLPTRRVVDPENIAMKNMLNILQKKLIYAIRKKSPFKLQTLEPGHWDKTYSALEK